MMSKLRFAIVATAALVLPLLAVEKSSAQFGFGFGRFGNQAGFGVSVGNPYGYGYNPYYGSYYGSYPYYGSYYGRYPVSPYWTTGYSSPWYGSTYYTSPTYYSSPGMYGSGYVTSTGTAPATGTGTMGTQSFYPPNTQGNTALIDVQVPANAQIWFDGESTSQTGTERAFRSPPLEQGQNYSYEVKARWTEDGKDIERTRKVRVRAGERVNVNFMANEEGVGTPKGPESEGTKTPPG
jgi:uncharacterized protein (TIGR03000 family)